MIANSRHKRLPHAAKLLTAWLLAAVSMTACQTDPAVRPGQPTAQHTTGAPAPEPLPAQPGQVIDIEARERIKDLALDKGTLVARAERNALLMRGVDAATATLIDSDIAWFEGDLNRADALLRQITDVDPTGTALVLEERHRRAALRSQWLTAAQSAHQLLATADTMNTGQIDQLWHALMHLDDRQLDAATVNARDASWRGWLELNRAYRRGNEATRQWLEANADHPARTDLPSGLDAWLARGNTETIAVLLPLSGRLQGAGEAVLNGIITQLYHQFQDPANRPTLLTVDTEEYPDAISAYREAIRRKADAVLGPLTKTDVQAIGNLRQRPIPVLALNRPEQLPAGRARSWSALSLAPEDEARQIARLAYGKGFRRALIIQPDSDWGSRMGSALTETWRGLGGAITRTHSLSQDLPLSEQISVLVGGAASEERIGNMEKAFEAPVEARARRRQDFDVVFMLAPTPSDARTLRPLLVFHYSGDVPVYSTSAIYSGNRHLANRDLNDVVFVEIPAVLNAVEIDRYTRLTALGGDAMSLLAHREQAEQGDLPFLRARTGILHRLPNGEIERELIPVEFAGDTVRPLRLPSTDQSL